MEIQITQSMLDNLKDKRLYFRPHFHHGDTLNKVIDVTNTVIAESYSRIPETSLSWNGSVSIGAFSYIVQGSKMESSSIGRFCSIGSGVKIMDQSHPIDRVTTSTWTYGNNVKNIVEKDFDCKIKQDFKVPIENGVRLGNDVWVANNVTFKRDISVGHGAVIAANSVVTKDVPPFAVVAGNPAKVVKFRFDEKIISDLLAIKWWNKSPKFLSGYNLSNVKDFIDCKDDFSKENDYDYCSYNLFAILKDMCKSD